MDEAVATFDAVWRAFASAAGTHPVAALAAGLTGLAAIVLARRAAMVPIAGFLAIAAVIGLEPVDEPILRTLFAIGCLATLVAVAAMARR